MTVTPAQIDLTLLAGMTTPGEASARVAALDDPCAALIELAVQAERLAVDDVAEAVRVARMLAGAGRSLHDAAGEARARRALAQALCYSNEFEGALAELQAAAAIEASHGISGDAVRAGLTLVHVLVCTGRLTEAVAEGRKARALALAEGREELAARADVNIGVCLRMQTLAAESLEHFRRARRVFEGQPAIAAQIDSNIAESLMDLDRFGEAEAAFHCALAGLEAAGALQGAAIVLGNLGDLAVRRGRVREALDHFERARRGMERAGAPTEAARLEAERVESLLAIGMTQEAVASFERVGPVLRRAGLKANLARALAAVGRGLVRLGRFDAAAAALAEARALFVELKNTPGIARTTLASARLCAARGDGERAMALARDAVAASGERPADRAAALAVLAEALAQGGHGVEALQAAGDGLAVAESLGLRTLRPSLLRAQGTAYRARGDVAAAADALEQAADEVERLRGTLPPERFRSAFHGEYAGIYAEWLACALDEGGDGAVRAAFHIAERSRGRALLDATAAAGVGAPARVSGDPDGKGASADEAAIALLDEVAEHRAAVAALYDELEDPTLARTDRTARGDWLARLAGYEAAIRAAESRLGATRRFGDALARPRALAEVQAALGEHALVEYFCVSGVIGAVVATREGASVMRRVADLADVDAAVSDFEFQVARALTRGFPGGRIGELMERDADAALDRLRELLWVPLLSRVGDRGAAVVPHGVLHAVPFAALRIAEGMPATSVVPSASVMLDLMGRAARLGEGSLVVGAADRLAPRAEDEACQIAANIPGAEALVGSRATRAAFLAAAPRRRLIHIASHATFNPHDPLASGIRLSDGWLTPRDLTGLDLGGAVVVLSACETGRGRASASEDVEGFVRSLLLAGASQVIMSLWPIHDESALSLMADLYRAWYIGACDVPARPSMDAGHGAADRRRGVGESGSGGGLTHSLAGALTWAQARLRATRPHPAAWAPFLCVGHP